MVPQKPQGTARKQQRRNELFALRFSSNKAENERGSCRLPRVSRGTPFKSEPERGVHFILTLKGSFDTMLEHLREQEALGDEKYKGTLQLAFTVWLGQKN